MNYKPQVKANMSITGSPVSGRGYGVDMVETHQEKITEKLGATPFPGTLNVVLDKPYLLKGADQLDSKGKLFGVRGWIGDVPCLLYRFNYTPMHVLEVIAPVHLRKTLDLIDGQQIKISVSADNFSTPSTWRNRFWELFYKDRLEAYYDDHMLKLFTRRGIKFFHKKACQSKKEFA